MCCFSANTSVFETSIFARLTRPGAQVLVYQMRYASAEPTAMILPLPVALPTREGAVRWTSLKEQQSFFDKLESGFPSKRPAPAAALPVHEVGDYIASFVPSVAAFDRIDPRFAIKKDVWSRIPTYHDYGFAVFQLKLLSGTPHPIAFEFETRLRDTVFFPTVHIHDGTVHDKDRFHHALYLQDARFDARVSAYVDSDHADPRTGFVRSHAKAASFADVAGSLGVLDGGLLVHRMNIWGLQRNTDRLIDILTSRAGACARCDAGAGQGGRVGVAPAVLAGGLAWLIRRRDQLRRS